MTTQKRKQALAGVLLIAVLILPLIVYTATFGGVISDNHARWGEFGSAVSGIYTPIMAALTLIVLVHQVRAQHRLNEHEFDQAYIVQARADIEFYLLRLATEMDFKISTGNTIGEVLHHQFRPSTTAELDERSRLDIANLLYRENPRVFAFWSGIYSVLAGLSAPERNPYSLTKVSASQKMIAMLSFKTCEALDNYHRSQSHGEIKVCYEFSQLLRVEGGSDAQ